MMNDDLSSFFVILVEPKYAGNIGAVARVMANFNIKNLFLVNPCELNDESYIRAKHAYKILDDAELFPSFKEAVENIDYLVATSSIVHKKDKKHLRNPVYIGDFSKKIFEIKGKIGLVFGREDYGLYNSEIAECDIMVKIPTSESYPSLNLSHAVCLVLFHLFVEKDFLPDKRREIGKIEKDKLYEFFLELLGTIDYPVHRRENTFIMLKRILGRAMLSKWEYHTLMGVINACIDKINENKK